MDTNLPNRVLIRGRAGVAAITVLAMLALLAKSAAAETVCQPSQPSGMFVCDGNTLPVAKPLKLSVKDCSRRVEQAECDASQPMAFRWLTEARREAGLDTVQTQVTATGGSSAPEAVRFVFKPLENDFASVGAVGIVTSLGWGGMTVESLDSRYSLTLAGTMPGARLRDCYLVQKSAEGYDVKSAECQTRAERARAKAAAAAQSAPAKPGPGKTVDQLYAEQEPSCKKALVRGLCQRDLKSKLCRENPGSAASSSLCSGL